MMRSALSMGFCIALLSGSGVQAASATGGSAAGVVPRHKEVIYQVFPRLFGNTNTTNKPWGTIEENGVGKFNDFTDRALQEIRSLAVS